MLELSDILQKNLISKESSQILGRVKDVYFSKKCDEIAYLILEDCIKNIHLIQPSEISAFGDALMTQSFALVKAVEDVDVTIFAEGLCGMQVYTQTGILKGSIENVQFSKQGKISKLSTQDYSFTPQNVAYANDIILLKAQTRTPKPRKIVIPLPSQDAPVELFNQSSDNSSAENNQNATLDAPKQSVLVFSAPPAVKLQDGVLFSDNALKMIGAPQIEDSSAITRIISDYSFLVGRTLSGDLKTFAGKPISYKGEVVTSQMIENARFAGKLTELVLLSK